MARSKRKPAKPERAAPAAPRAEKAQDGHADLIATARKRWDRAENRDRDNKLAAYDDLAFLAGEQYTAEELKERDGRPCLTINRLPQFVEQVTGEIRQMRPAVKAVPVDRRGDPDTAEIIAGIVRYVENRSSAPEAVYPQGADSQVAAGIGHWQVTSEYADDSTFEQELRIAPIDDGIAVRWDPDASLPTRADAMFCFVPVDLSRDAFEDRYPDASVASWESEDGLNFTDWLTDDHVRVAVYWYKKPVKKMLALMPDGAIEDVTDDPEAAAEAKAAGARVELRPGHKVCRAVISATEVLEGPTEWPGRHIPVIPVIGREIRLGRKTFRYGLVRFAKDPQRLFNYAESAKAETIGQQPKAPFLVTDDNIADFEDEWARANRENLPYLRYTPDPKNGNAAPQRINPPVSSPAVAEMVRSSAENLHAVTGIYPAALGAQSNETSGKAILARQREGDTGTFVFVKNFGLAIKRTAEIVTDLIPHIYDTARTVRIVGDDGKVDLVDINQPHGLAEMPEGEEGDAVHRVLHDVTVGAYDVVVDMGPSYATKQAEAREGMTALIQAAPEVAPLIMDLIAKAQDWPLADKIGKRARLLLPPSIQQMEAEEEGEPMPPPAAAQPDPLAERAAALEEAKLALEELKLQVEALKANADLEKAHLDAQGRALEAARPPEAPQQPAPEKAAGAAPDAGLAAIAERVEMLTAAMEEIDTVLGQVVQALAVPLAEPDLAPEIAIDPAMLPADGTFPGGPATA